MKTLMCKKLEKMKGLICRMLEEIKIHEGADVHDAVGDKGNEEVTAVQLVYNPFSQFVSRLELEPD